MNKRQRKKFVTKHYQKTYWSKLKNAKTVNQFFSVYYPAFLINKLLKKPNYILGE